MNPHLSNNDMNMFYKYLNTARVYFEYGSGGSTYQVSLLDNIQKIYTVESDKEWQDKLLSSISNDKIVFIYNEMDTSPNTWGNPGKNATDHQKINYSNHILNLDIEEQQGIDLVFIDGRFRVACCLKCFDVIKDSCLIMFDDFLNRKQYHIVLNYFEIIDKTADNRMVILKKKRNVAIPPELIHKYELIRD